MFLFASLIISIHALINEWWLIEFNHLNIFLIPSSFSKFMIEMHLESLHCFWSTISCFSSTNFSFWSIISSRSNSLNLFTSCSKLFFSKLLKFAYSQFLCSLIHEHLWTLEGILAKLLFIIHHNLRHNMF